MFMKATCTPAFVKDDVVSWLDGGLAVMGKHRANGSIGLKMEEIPFLL